LLEAEHVVFLARCRSERISHLSQSLCRSTFSKVWRARKCLPIYS